MRVSQDVRVCAWFFLFISCFFQWPSFKSELILSLCVLWTVSVLGGGRNVTREGVAIAILGRYFRFIIVRHGLNYSFQCELQFF